MGDWSLKVTPKLKKKLQSSAHKCLSNGESLLEDAEVLSAAGKFNRALVLAVFAEEELAKAFMLHVAAEGRWDSALFSALTQHEAKQQLAEAIRYYVNNAWAFVRSQQSQLVPPRMPSPGAVDYAVLDRAIKNAKTSKRVRERQKHHSLYTGVNGDGTVDSEPTATEEDYVEIRAEAIQMRDLVSVAVKSTLPHSE